MAMFTGFHSYDDEGFFLQVFRDYLSGTPLLTPATPIYGPFFFETLGGLFRFLGVEPGHEAGRYVTLALWLAASLVSGLTAYRLTASLVLGVCGELVMFHVLGALTNEPMSPSGLIALLLTGLLAAATYRSQRPRATAMIIGAIVAALCLVKVNVGAFAGIAVVFAALYTRQLGPKIVPFALVGVAVVWLPVVLMAPLLHQAWVVELAIGLSVSGLLAVWTVFLVMPSSALRPPPAAWRWLGAGGAALAAICPAIALAGGTRPADLWSGLFAASLRFPRVFAYPLQVNPAFDVWSVAVAVGAFVAWYRRIPAARVAGALRVAAGLFTLLSPLLLPSSIFLLSLPLVWMASARPGTATTGPVQDYSRLLLPVLAVLEALQAYPVAGTQLSMAAVCVVPLGLVVLVDGARQLEHARMGRPSRLAAWAPPIALLAAVQVSLLIAYLTVEAFTAATPLGLPGAVSIRVPPDQAAQLREVVAAIDDNCSSFITLPGMNSLYVWTGQKPPVDMRSEVWMATYDDAQQQAVVNRVQALPRLCVVENLRLVDFWMGGNQVPDRPLVSFIQQKFVSSGTYGDYKLLSHRQD